MHSLSIQSLYARFGPFIRFCLVGASGILVNSAVYGLFTLAFGVNYLYATLPATLASSSWNCLLTELWVFPTAADHSTWLRRAVPFFLLNLAALAVRAPIIYGLTDGLRVNSQVSNLISLTLLVVVRYLVARAWIWRSPAPRTPRAPAPLQAD
jgi:dolichol-phosphate mannosyltransferase